MQLRTDKIQTIEEETWNRISEKLMCGLTVDRINRIGVNANKYSAYLALASSATEPWPELDIDKCIVINDVETEVEGLVDYLDEAYNMTRKVMKVPIKHTDGIGMMLPRVSRKNVMIRSSWLKGLLTSFDFLRFCKVNNVHPVLTDVWGQQHDLIAEDIEVIFFKSQLKMWEYYTDWNEYKDNFKRLGCCFNKTNEEEDYIKDTTLCYQFLQTLTSMTDEEIDKLTKQPLERIQQLSSNAETMLEVLRADINSDIPYQRALAIYPELLREAYFKDTIKQTKTKWVLDARSGKIKCENKRLFVIPDMYFVCGCIFLGEEHAQRLLERGEVACIRYRNKDEVDCLRSPSLYLEHSIQKVVKDTKIYQWFYTDGIYTSADDLISKVLQFDCDGDQLNVVADQTIIDAAKRELEITNTVPLYYELGKAPAHHIDRKEMFNGLKRAHENSGIGEVSNSLTKLFSKENPDRYAAAVLTAYNNWVIDSAKTGKNNSYENYPEVKRIVNKAIGGKKGRLPFFFVATKNGRKSDKKSSDYAKWTPSTMNRIYTKFDCVGNINMSKAKIPPFNWQMLLSGNETEYNAEAVQIFCDLDNSYVATMVWMSDQTDRKEIEDKYNFIKEIIIDELSKFGPLENTYGSITKFLFAGSGMDKPGHKQMYWRIFGDIACSVLAKNMETYTVCEKCGMKIPSWATYHDCKSKDSTGFFECVDCGCWVQRQNSRQYRCESCQEEYRRFVKRKANYINYIPKYHRQQNPYKYKDEIKEDV